MRNNALNIGEFTYAFANRHDRLKPDGKKDPIRKKRYKETRAAAEDLLEQIEIDYAELMSLQASCPHPASEVTHERTRGLYTCCLCARISHDNFGGMKAE